MTAILATRDALIQQATAWHYARSEAAVVASPEEHMTDLVDTLLASGAVIDVATLADDRALVEAIAADQKEAADSWGEPLPGAERNMRARTALRALAAALSERTS